MTTRPACTDVSLGYHPDTKHPREVMLTFADGITEVYSIADHSGAALLPNGWHIRLGSRVTCGPPPPDPSKPPTCSQCGEPIRPLREGDGLDPRDFDWTHEAGNPICDITPEATP